MEMQMALNFHKFDILQPFIVIGVCFYTLSFCGIIGMTPFEYDSDMDFHLLQYSSITLQALLFWYVTMTVLKIPPHQSDYLKPVILQA